MAIIGNAKDKTREVWLAKGALAVTRDEWPEPEGDFGHIKIGEPLARALRNSPPYMCPNLDNLAIAKDQDRAGMAIEPRWLQR